MSETVDLWGNKGKGKRNRNKTFSGFYLLSLVFLSVILMMQISEGKEKNGMMEIPAPMASWPIK